MAKTTTTNDLLTPEVPVVTPAVVPEVTPVVTPEVTAHPRQAEIDAINAARVAKGIKPIGNTENATIDAALQHGQKNGYFNTPAVEGSVAQMNGGISNKADNTSTTTETTDTSGVQDATMKMVQAMQNEGLTYSQAFEKFYPKPVRNTATEEDLRRRQKLALFSDMFRLATEGVGAFKGASIQKRDQSQPYAGLAGKLAQEYATYSAGLNEWQKKGVDAVMNDIKNANELYSKNLANAPKTRVTTEDKRWDREKFQTQQAFDEKKLKQDKDLADKDRKAANYRASVSAGTHEPKQTQIIFADNNGTALIDNKKVDSLYNSAYQAMLNDPTFMNSGNRDAKQIEAINNDYSFEGKAAKIKVYVDQHSHESPSALELIKKNAVSYTRADAAPQSTQSAPASPAAPWLVVPTPTSNTAPWLNN